MAPVMLAAPVIVAAPAMLAVLAKVAAPVTLSAPPTVAAPTIDAVLDPVNAPPTVIAPETDMVPDTLPPVDVLMTAVIGVKSVPSQNSSPESPSVIDTGAPAASPHVIAKPPLVALTTAATPSKPAAT